MDEEERIVPQSDIELQMLFTDPKWGGNVPDDLKDKLTRTVKEYITKDEAGKDVNVKVTEELWGQLAFFTRDIRLSNLSRFNGELERVQWALDMAGDCLRGQHAYPTAFMAAITSACVVTESTQGVGGFLRKRQGTISKEEIKGEMGPSKRGLFSSMKKKESNGGY